MFSFLLQKCFEMFSLCFGAMGINQTELNQSSENDLWTVVSSTFRTTIIWYAAGIRILQRELK